MSLPRGAAIGALVALMALLGAIARADTIHTRDGQRLKGKVVSESESQLTLEGEYGTLTIAKRDIVSRRSDPRTFRLGDGSLVIGEVVRESDEELIVRTPYGALAIPTSAIRSIDGAPGPAEPRVLTAAERTRVQRLHQRASRLHGDKRYKEAIAAYSELLELSPDDDTALYNIACAHSLLGHPREAVDFLEQAVAAGFTNFQHIEADTDLDAIRQERGYLRLLEDKDRYLRYAAAKTTERLRRELKEKGARGEYRTFVDEERNIIFLYTRGEERLGRVREQLDGYARLQWRDLFRNRIRQPLHILLLDREDGGAMLEEGVGGYFNPATNVLVCGDLPSMTLGKANVVVHEFTHALHFADQQARGQPHPIWLVEGLASLFESAVVKDDRLVCKHSARLSTVQQALRRGRVIEWRRLMQMDQPAFMREASVGYAQSRYMLFYMWEKGYLKRFYDEYTSHAAFEGDRTALESFEVVFGKPIDEVQRDWERWLAEQEPPAVPFIGISSAAVEGGLRIDVVQPGTAASRGGIEVGDVIRAIDGTAVRQPDDLLEVLSTREVGDDLEVELRRGDETKKVTITLGRRR